MTLVWRTRFLFAIAWQRMGANDIADWFNQGSLASSKGPGGQRCKALLKHAGPRGVCVCKTRGRNAIHVRAAKSRMQKWQAQASRLCLPAYLRKFLRWATLPAGFVAREVRERCENVCAVQ